LAWANGLPTSSDPAEPRGAALARFEALRAQIPSLKLPGKPGDDFVVWYHEVVRAIDSTWGPNSDQRREFEAIRFGFHPVDLDRAAAAVDQFVRDQTGTGVPTDFSLSTAHYFQQRLTDADELLLTFCLSLKRNI
jgi:hypothetical protein